MNSGAQVGHPRSFSPAWAHYLPLSALNLNSNSNSNLNLRLRCCMVESRISLLHFSWPPDMLLSCLGRKNIELLEIKPILGAYLSNFSSSFLFILLGDFLNFVALSKKNSILCYTLCTKNSKRQNKVVITNLYLLTTYH